MDYEIEDSEALRALASDVRRRILTLLNESPRSVTELTDFFTISRPAISRHLKVLLEAGLVRKSRSGRSNLYEIDHEALTVAVTDCVPHPPSSQISVLTIKTDHEQAERDLNRTHVCAPNGNRTKMTKEFLRTPVQVSATYQLG